LINCGNCKNLKSILPVKDGKFLYQDAYAFCKEGIIWNGHRDEPLRFKYHSLKWKFMTYRLWQRAGCLRYDE